MKDIQGYLEKLQVQTAECEMIRDLATDPKKRELFNEMIEGNGAPMSLGLTEEEVFGLFDIQARPKRPS